MGKASRRGRVIGPMAAVVVVSALFGCAAPSGDPLATPSPLAFPLTPTGGTTTRDLTITNEAASGALTLESMAVAGPAASMFADGFDDDSTTVLDPGESTTVAVTYAPTAAGDHVASLRVDNSSGGTLDVPLSGSAVAREPGSAPLTATPAAVAFPATPLGETVTHTVDLRNDAAGGTIDVLSATVTGPDGPMFEATADMLPDDLEPGATLQVQVAFSPSATGPRAAVLSIDHTGTNAPLQVPLSGEGTGAGALPVLHRVNAGGPPIAVTTPGEPAWAEDSAAAPSPYAVTAASAGMTTWPNAVDVLRPVGPGRHAGGRVPDRALRRPRAPEPGVRLPGPGGHGRARAGVPGRDVRAVAGGRRPCLRRRRRRPDRVPRRRHVRPGRGRPGPGPVGGHRVGRHDRRGVPARRGQSGGQGRRDRGGGAGGSARARTVAVGRRPLAPRRCARR